MGEFAGSSGQIENGGVTIDPQLGNEALERSLGIARASSLVPLRRLVEMQRSGVRPDRDGSR